jgi:hypothetical protein
MSVNIVRCTTCPLHLILIPVSLISISVHIVYAWCVRLFYLIVGAKATSPEAKSDGEETYTIEQAESGECVNKKVQHSELKIDGPMVGDIFGFLSYTFGGWTRFWFPRVERHQCPVFAVNVGVPGVACLDMASAECMFRNRDVLKDNFCPITLQYPFTDEGLVANFFKSGPVARSIRNMFLALVPTSVHDEQFQRGIQVMKARMLVWTTFSPAELKVLTSDKVSTQLCTAFVSGMLFGQALDTQLISTIFPIPYILPQHPMVSHYLFPQYYTALVARKELFAQAKNSPYWSKIMKIAQMEKLNEQVAFDALFVAITFNAYGLSNIIMNALYIISQLPDGGKGLLNDEACLDSFAWELIRNTGPAFAINLKNDATISTSNGQHFCVSKGTRLMTHLTLVNRDGAVYSDPHIFKMDRFNPLPPRDLTEARPRVNGKGMEEPLPLLTFGCPLGLADDKDAFYRSHQCVFRHMAQPCVKEIIKIFVQEFAWKFNEKTEQTMQQLHVPSSRADDIIGAHAAFNFHPDHMVGGSNGAKDTTVRIDGGAWFEKFQKRTPTTAVIVEKSAN